MADALDVDMSAAATGGELVMAVRDDLKKLLNSQPELLQGTVDLARRIIRTIDATGW
jgi:hypothetical protein